MHNASLNTNIECWRKIKVTSSNESQADRKINIIKRLLSFAVRSWMHGGLSGLQRGRAKWLAVDTIIVWELLTCRAEQQVATLLLLTSMSHCNQRRIHKEGCSSYCTPPGHHVQSRCQHVCVCVRQCLWHAAATLKSIFWGVFMFVDTYEHVPCPWEHPPCDKINLKENAEQARCPRLSLSMFPC